MTTRRCCGCRTSRSSRTRRPPAQRSQHRPLLATTCEEGPLPWSPPGPALRPALEGRVRQRRPRCRSPPSPPSTARPRPSSAEIRFCAHWPASGPARSPPAAPTPDVPVLMLSGAADLRTPAEDAAAVAARFPRATKLTIPFAGHSVIGSDQSGCAQRVSDAVPAQQADHGLRLARHRGQLRLIRASAPARGSDPAARHRRGAAGARRSGQGRARCCARPSSRSSTPRRACRSTC